MTRQSLDAVDEKGMFRVLGPLDMVIPEGQRVRIVVDAEDATDVLLALAAQVYEGLTPHEIDDIEQFALDQRRFFDPREHA